MERIYSKKRPPRLAVLDCTGSSNLVGGRYNRATQELQIDFKGNVTYAYPGVTAQHWEGLRTADSKGKYLAAEIKPNYPAHKLEAA